MNGRLKSTLLPKVYFTQYLLISRIIRENFVISNITKQTIEVKPGYTQDRKINNL